MNGAHCKFCLHNDKECKCNSCKNDFNSGLPCCCLTFGFEGCPVSECPDYEPDDEEDDDA